MGRGGLSEIMDVRKCFGDEKSRHKAEGGGGFDGRKKTERDVGRLLGGQGTAATSALIIALFFLSFFKCIYLFLLSHFFNYI